MRPHHRKITAIVSKLLEWYAREARDLPWRRTSDPYSVFVSEIMLQQTQVATVVPYYERWMRELPSISALAAAPEERLLKLWEGLGYYSRVRNLRQAAVVITEEHGGKFPRDYSDVLALPGVGPYTAGAICSIAFNQPAPILDGNVIRVLTRLFAIDADPRSAKTSRALWDLAGQLVTCASVQAPRGPTGACSSLNQSLMELGALVCTRTNPGCAGCPIASVCIAKRKGQVERFPMARPRPTVIRKRFVVLLAACAGKILIRQRPAAGHNGLFWEFPALEVREQSPAEAVATLLPGIALSHPVHSATMQHTITRYRITLEAYSGTMKRQHQIEGMRWVPADSLETLPFSTAHRKVLRLIKSAV